MNFGRRRDSSGDREILPTHRRETRSERQPAEAPVRSGGLMYNVKSYARQYALDWVTIFVIGAAAMCVNNYAPAVGGETRWFRLLPEDATAISPRMEDLSTPYRKQIIGFWLSAGLDVGIPAVTIALLELCTRGNFLNFARALYGTVHSVIMCCTVQIVIKKVSGGFRPSFLSVCQPVIDRPGEGIDGTWYKSDICTGDPDKVRWALESFPSGHVATAFAGGVFLSLYINGKLKVYADYRANPAVILFTFYPTVLAILMAGAISTDMSHHWYDILGGAILGSTLAFLSYRNSYISVLDPRYNHIGQDNARRFTKDEYVYSEYRTKFGFPIFSQKKLG